MLSIVLCETIFKFSYMFFFKSLPVPLLTVRHIYEISEMTTMHLERQTIVTGLRSLMNFTLRCVCFYPGVNSNPRPGLTPGTVLRAVGSGTIFLRYELIISPRTFRTPRRLMLNYKFMCNFENLVYI